MIWIILNFKRWSWSAMQWDYIKEDLKIEVDAVNYDLEHLKTSVDTVTIPAKGRYPEVKLTLVLKYSSHCVTEGKQWLLRKGVTACSSIIDEGGQERCFSKERYKLSLSLPVIMKDIVEKQCYFGKHRNFIVVEQLDNFGQIQKYHVFFNIRKKGKGRIEIYVESAYVPVHSMKLHKKVKGFVLLGKTYRGEKIKAPK
ncbi:hypothetical protein [Desulfovibrio sp. JC010]|uniref:hypothetical protein n=1 Tax=Desulfovibrio sp. JC010 TaxID=2593641 RepID=UPI0013D56155|nr:hypothetical protein [Desulfovibrio sp. JC010]NDV25083.1 hypothetical protein [Desulfovibrio sp. JC010]